jgi:hypothetical protein
MGSENCFIERMMLGQTTGLDKWPEVIMIQIQF